MVTKQTGGVGAYHGPVSSICPPDEPPPPCRAHGAAHPSCAREHHDVAGTKRPSERVLELGQPAYLIGGHVGGGEGRGQMSRVREGAAMGACTRVGA